MNAMSGNGGRVKDRQIEQYKEQGRREKETLDYTDEVKKPIKTLQRPYACQEKVCIPLNDAS